MLCYTIDLILHFIILIFIPSLAAQSVYCDLMDKIGADIQISADETGVSSWNVLQLKQKLGAPSYTKILGADTFYEWKSFIAFQYAEGGGSGSGYYPGFDPKNGIQTAVKVLGNPPMQVTDHLTQYE